jgi:hypothetical protein
MKGLKTLFIIMTAVMLAVGISSIASAFHGGGVAHCDGCHSMHNSADNPIGSAATANSLLLKGSDASSTCLNCHAGVGSYHIASTTLDNTNAGGDFGWVRTDYTAIIDGNPVVFDGQNSGHNIIAIDFGYAADLRSGNTQAPGGTYSSNLLGCTSCHDAHGQVHGGTKMGSAPISGSGSYGDPDPTDGSQLGNFRLLGDSDYEAGSAVADNYAFSYDAPIAVTTNSTANNTSYGADTAYGSGMSEWCANCHDDFLNQSTKHVAGSGNGVLDGIGTNYGCYIKTGDWDCSQSGTSYDELVPFERGVSVARTSLSVTDTSAPGAGAQVMCLTCHRAHASAHSNSGRWDLSIDMIARSAALTAIDLPGTEIVYYDSTGEVDVAVKYGKYQRSLCNKCHVQD